MIFAEGATTGVVEALSPLLELRKEQAGERFREYRGESAPDPKETKQRWLARHKMGAGPANPAKVPYYLLLVGDPTALPYQFQYQLDVQYAVGRISFDTADEYHHTPNRSSMPNAADGEIQKNRAFGPRNQADGATKLSAAKLVAPLETDLSGFGDWKVEASIGEDATKSRLASLLADSDGASILFTASHGMAFPSTDVRQLNAQGDTSARTGRDHCAGGADRSARSSTSRRPMSPQVCARRSYSRLHASAPGRRIGTTSRTLRWADPTTRRRLSSRGCRRVCLPRRRRPRSRSSVMSNGRGVAVRLG